MTSLIELWSLAAVQRSALGLLIGAVSLPVVGVFIVGLDIIAVRFAVMHVALLGIAGVVRPGAGAVLGSQRRPDRAGAAGGDRGGDR
ncbi:MAG: hypothetical protein ACRDS0_11505 [Pseudonocardiaceae bacterium]